MTSDLLKPMAVQWKASSPNVLQCLPKLKGDSSSHTLRMWTTTLLGPIGLGLSSRSLWCHLKPSDSLSLRAGTEPRSSMGQPWPDFSGEAAEVLLHWLHSYVTSHLLGTTVRLHEISSLITDFWLRHCNFMGRRGSPPCILVPDPMTPTQPPELEPSTTQQGPTSSMLPGK